MIHWHAIVSMIAGALIALGLLGHFAVGMAASGDHPDEKTTATRFIMAGAVLFALVFAT